MSYNTVVIDIESFDVKSTAVILSVGGFAFDIGNIKRTQTEILSIANNKAPVSCSRNSFYRILDTHHQLFAGRTVSSKTQAWWKEQPGAEKALSGEYVKLKSGLISLNDWLQQLGDVRVYFRGTDFDGAILEDAYSQTGVHCPWRYNEKRDLRTFIDARMNTTTGYIKGFKPCFSMIKHHSLHDAMNDAEQMCIAFNNVEV